MSVCDRQPTLIGTQATLVMTSAVRLPEGDVPADAFVTDLATVTRAVNVDRFKVEVSLAFEPGMSGTASVR